jgi:hypothetical protein
MAAAVIDPLDPVPDGRHRPSSGTHSYGAGVTIHLQSAGMRGVEVIRPNRQVRQMRGKWDPIHANEAANAVPAGAT